MSTATTGVVLMTPVWKEEKDQEREELETEVRGHNASMTASIFLVP